MSIETPGDELKDREQKLYDKLDKKLKSVEVRTSKFNELVARVDSEEDGCFKELSEIKNEFKNVLSNNSIDEGHLMNLSLEADIRKRIEYLESQYTRPIHLMLQIALGKTVNVTLRPFEKRIIYKREYEFFKFKCGVISFLYSLLSLLLLENKIFDAAYSFFMLYYFCTCVLRENILIVNGSKIKLWWLLHHYVSIILSGVILIWPNTHIYKAFRKPFFSYFIYVSLLQYLQYRYQQSRLYILVALDRAGPMETVGGDGLYINTVSKKFHLLLPFLIIGQFWQIANGIILARLHWIEEISRMIEWQAILTGALFVLLGIGNLIATLNAYKERCYDMATKINTVSSIDDINDINNKKDN